MADRTNNQCASMDMSAEVAGGIAHKAIDDMKNKREVEKEEMQSLNDRFANYVSQVRSLEAENKALREQLKKKRKDFDPEPMKEIYQTEIDETKKLLEEANKDNADLKVHKTTLEDELEDQRSLKIKEYKDDTGTHVREAWNAKFSQCMTELTDEYENRLAEMSPSWRISQLLSISESAAKSEPASAVHSSQESRKKLSDAYQEYLRNKELEGQEDDTGQNVCEAWTVTFSKCMRELKDTYEEMLPRWTKSQEIAEYKAMSTKEDGTGTNVCEAWTDPRATLEILGMHDLKDETNQCNAAYSQADTLQDKLDIWETITDPEIKKGYKAMLAKEYDTGTDVCETWNGKFSKCMKELRDKYEMSPIYVSQLQQICESTTESEPASPSSQDKIIRSDNSQKDMRIKELESQLARMTQEIRNLTNQLDKANDDLDHEKKQRSAEVKKLHDEMEAMLNELQMLMDAKLSLELEIAAYRKLLESEENRLTTT